MHTLFAQQRTAMNADRTWMGCLGNEWRMRAEAAGDPGPWRQRAILGGMRTHCPALCASNVIEHPADDDAVLVIDETGFLEQGKASGAATPVYRLSW
jgi:hypothetical protein